MLSLLVNESQPEKAHSAPALLSIHTHGLMRLWPQYIPLHSLVLQYQPLKPILYALNPKPKNALITLIVIFGCTTPASTATRKEWYVVTESSSWVVMVITKSYASPRVCTSLRPK